MHITCLQATQCDAIDLQQCVCIVVVRVRLNVLKDMLRENVGKDDLILCDKEIELVIHTVHSVQKKRGHSFFLHNFNKCRYSFVIFGTNHPEDSFY